MILLKYTYLYSLLKTEYYKFSALFHIILINDF
nr:MAG TPA: hypothetical protein [Caudoviricetes sp.]